METSIIDKSAAEGVVIPDNIPVEGEQKLEGIDFISSGEQYLTFILGDENYAVDILSVKEIRGWEDPTSIPHAADYVKGVLNLRGLIVPTIDLRIRFGVGEVTYKETTVVIVLSGETEGATRTMGFVVDAVSDVLNADEDEIQAAPEFGGTLSRDYIRGLVNVGDDVVTVLEPQKLMNLEN